MKFRRNILHYAACIVAMLLPGCTYGKFTKTDGTTVEVWSFCKDTQIGEVHASDSEWTIKGYDAKARIEALTALLEAAR